MILLSKYDPLALKQTLFNQKILQFISLKIAIPQTEFFRPT